MDQKWLEAQFKLYPDKKKSDLARTLKIGTPAISKILAGTREVKAHEYVGMRKFFGLPTDGRHATTVKNAPSNDMFVIKPFAQGVAYSGMRDGANSNADHTTKQDDWVIPASLMKGKTSASSDQIVSFKITEDAMKPDFKTGEYVLVDCSIKKPSPSGAFLISDGLGEIVRQCEFVPQSSPPSMKVSAKMPGYEAYTLVIQPDTIIGRVIAKIEWV